MTMSMDADCFLKLDIRGRHMVIDRESLARYPNSRLSKLGNDSPSYIQQTGEHYFNVNSNVMEKILDAYGEGGMYFDSNTSCLVVQEHLSFWGLDATVLASCYRNRYLADLQEIKHLTAIQRSDFTREVQQLSGRRGAIYRFLEKPKSTLSMVWHCTVLGMICFSIMVFMKETQRHNRRFFYGDQEELYVNVTHNRIGYLLSHTLPVTSLILTELLITIILCIDVITRFIVAPNRRQFFSFLNIADLIGTIPVVVMFILLGILWALHYYSHSIVAQPIIDLIWLFSAMRLFRLFRFVRVLQRARIMRVLQSTLRASLNELLVLAACNVILVILMGNLMFFAEMNHGAHDDGHMSSAYSGVWWAIVTMTTVGYGDIVPMTGPAKWLGGFCMLLAVLNMALPVAVFTSHFLRIHSQLQLIETFGVVPLSETAITYSRDSRPEHNTAEHEDTERVRISSNQVCEDSRHLEEAALIDER